MGSLLSERVRITRVLANVADGQTDSYSSSVDMAGFDGVIFLILIGTITGSGTSTWNLAQGTDDASFDDLEDTVVATAAAQSDCVLMLEAFRPTDRYVRAEYVRATANSEIDGVIAIQYNARDRATVLSGLTDYDQSITPDES